MFNCLFFIISFLGGIFTSLPSEEIWSKTVKYLQKFNISLYQDYFIYDEKSYIGSSLNEDPLNSLVQKQEELYANYTIRNYIFFVEKVNEEEEEIKVTADNLSKKIGTWFQIDMSKSITSIFSISTRKMYIRTDKDIMNIITNDEAKQIISDITPDLRNQNYYNACSLLIEKFDYYYNHQLSNDSIIPYLIYLFIFIIFSSLLAYILIINKCRLPYDEDLIIIVDFLKRLKRDNTLFAKYCIICCTKLTPEKKEEELTLLSDSTRYHVRLIDPFKEIKTLNCQHQFHNRCLNQWMELNKECPICLYNNNNEEYGKIVWNIQLQFHPSFKKIKYKHLYTRGFNPKNNGGIDYNGGGYGGVGYGGGGGSGGAGGGW